MIQIIVMIVCYMLPGLVAAQQWYSYNPTAGFDINTVAIPQPGNIAIGGGWETDDSAQVMFLSNDFGQTWTENAHDGLGNWNKSIAFANVADGIGAGYNGRIVRSYDGGANWGYDAYPINRDFNKILHVNAQTYLIAGGNRSNDSVQTILKTIDGGDNWLVMLDQPGPWLKSIFFTDSLTGFAVGDSGVILATVNGGTAWPPVAAPVQRDFNAVTFLNTDTGFIAGGDVTHRTILRTYNGGVNWVVVMDVTGGILNDISFVNSLTGYAVGDSATVLKTTDGGTNWVPVVIDINLTGNEQIRAVKFAAEDFGVVAGQAGLLYVYRLPVPYRTFSTEQPSAVTYTSAILNGTVDSAALPLSLSFEFDTTPSFAQAMEVSAFPAQVNDTMLYQISGSANTLLPLTGYYYRLKGMAGSYTYYGTTRTFFTAGGFGNNVFETDSATAVTDTSAVLHGSISGFYFATPVPVSFEYGTTTAFGNEVTAGTVALNDTFPDYPVAIAGGLSPDTGFYFYRIKVTAGSNVYYGNTRKLYTGVPEIPNWDFNRWQNTTVQLPSGWSVVGQDYEQVPGRTGGYAPKLSYQNVLANCRFTATAQGSSGIDFIDAQPFHYRPDSLIFYANFNNAPGDSALVWLRLYTANTTVAFQNIKLSGNSGGQYQRMSFPVNYSSGITPDSLVLAFLSLDMQTQNPSYNSANYLAVDDISFQPAAAPAVENGSFDDWYAYSFLELLDWEYWKYLPGSFSQGIAPPHVTRTLFQTPDDYACQIQAYAFDGSLLNTRMGHGSHNFSYEPGFAIAGKHDVLNGYYAYFPVNGDTMTIQLSLFKAGQRIGGGYMTSADTVAVLTPFEMILYYYDTLSVPDSAAMEIVPCQRDVKGDSRLLLDKLSFDGFRINVIDSYNYIPSVQDDGIKVYPNPAKNILLIETQQPAGNNNAIQLFDLQGRLVKEIKVTTGNRRLQIDLSDVTAGFYMLRFMSEQHLYCKKIIIEK